MERPIGVSIFSFFPLFLLPGGYSQIRDMVGDLGVQLLPLREMRARNIEKFNVLSFEGPWNCGSLYSALKGTLRIKGDYPSLLDIGLFGSERACRRRVQMIADLNPQALPIDVSWIANSAIELGPNMHLGSARQWQDKKPSGVVLDTYHWRRFHPVQAERLLEDFGGKSAIRMVHLKLMTTKETREFLVGQGPNSQLLKQFLTHDKQAQIPVIIEAKPNALFLVRYNTPELLRSLADQVQTILA